MGRLEGFRFSQDTSQTPEEAKMLHQAAMTALRPEFHLRADRFYNAPDTEIDFTEQGGLMWGEHAVGKLVKGGDAFKPTVQAFVEEDAGHDVVEKVTRRLQHFIDRKVATLFEPLLSMSKDETLTGLPRGFAFQMLEGFGHAAARRHRRRGQGAGPGSARPVAQAWRALRAVHGLHAASAETRADAAAAGALVALERSRRSSPRRRRRAW